MPNQSFFSLDSIPENQRLRVLREAFYDKYQLNINCLDDRNLSLDGAHVDLGDIEIFGSKGSPMLMSRLKNATKGDRNECFLMPIVKSGSIIFEQRNRAGRIMAGQVGMLHHSEPHCIEEISWVNDVYIKIPCDLLRDRIKNVDDFCGSEANFANPMLVPVVSQLASQILKFDFSEKINEMEHALIDLVCLMLETRSEFPQTSRARHALAEMTFQRITDYLQDNFGDHDLTPAKAAVIHRMSVSNLHRIFQARGKSFSRTLMEIRLMEAHRLLTIATPERTRLSIGEISYRCGFVSQAHFSTKFHDYFGTTPRSVASNGN